MSVTSEITRLQNAKTSLKTAINSKLGSNTPINNETIDQYASFVNNIETGGKIPFYTSSVSTSNYLQWYIDRTSSYIYIYPQAPEVYQFAKNLDTSNATSMYKMFKGCSDLTSLDLTNFNTSNVTNMEQMFYNCISLQMLDLSSFDFTNVTSYNQMFYNVPNNCLIWVRDQASYDWVMARKSSFTNVHIKTYYNLVFNVTPSTATIVVKDSSGNVVNPVSNGTYSLTYGTYSYLIRNEGYKSIYNTITLNSNETITETMVEGSDTPVGITDWTKYYNYLDKTWIGTGLDKVLIKETCDGINPGSQSVAKSRASNYITNGRLLTLDEFNDSFGGSATNRICKRDGNAAEWWLSTYQEYVQTSGYINKGSESDSRYVRPAVDVSSTGLIVGGTGTEQDPYIIE